MENNSQTNSSSTMSFERILIGNIYLWTTLFLSIPYIICWYIIKRQKYIFDESFRLFILNMGVAEILELIMLGLYPAIVCLLPIEPPYWLGKFLGAISGLGWNSYTALAQMVSLNRFVSVYWPTKWTTIYSKKRTYCIIVISWLYGTIWLSLYSTNDATLTFKVSYRGMVYDLNEKYSKIAFFMNTVANWVHAISLPLLYSLIYLKVRRKDSTLCKISKAVL
uniref:7TM GPCR serpentine receptor class x (Srx) domain-containing protein n=1 Tax=Romanomermis culicivorax TaxID=13658 RepID=A0A915J033_ROMCU